MSESYSPAILSRVAGCEPVWRMSESRRAGWCPSRPRSAFFPGLDPHFIRLLCYRLDSPRATPPRPLLPFLHFSSVHPGVRLRPPVPTSNQDHRLGWARRFLRAECRDGSERVGEVSLRAADWRVDATLQGLTELIHGPLLRPQVDAGAFTAFPQSSERRTVV